VVISDIYFATINQVMAAIVKLAMWGFHLNHKEPFFFFTFLAALGSVASLLAATLFQGNQHRNHKVI
jgi:hypothetical protein